MDKKCVGKGGADHLSRMRIEDELPINDSLPEEKVMVLRVLQDSYQVKKKLDEVQALDDEKLLWYADYVNFLVCGEVTSDLDSYHKNKFFRIVNHIFLDDLYLFKRGSDDVFSRCVAEEEVEGIFYHCHGSSYGGHFATFKTVTKVLQGGFWWPSMLKDAQAYISKCDPY